MGHFCRTFTYVCGFEDYQTRLQGHSAKSPHHCRQSRSAWNPGQTNLQGENLESYYRLPDENLIKTRFKTKIYYALASDLHQIDFRITIPRKLLLYEGRSYD